MKNVVSVKSLSGKTLIFYYDTDYTFAEFFEKVDEEFQKMEDRWPEDTHNGKKVLSKLVCMGKQLDEEYYEEMKYNFANINCIHAVYSYAKL